MSRVIVDNVASTIGHELSREGSGDRPGVVDQGLTAAQVAARFGVSRQWVHVLLRRPEVDGLDGLRSAAVLRGRVREPRRARCGSGSSSLRRQLSRSGADAGPETIAWHLEGEGHRAPSTSMIRRILHLGIGRIHAGQPVLMLIHDQHVITSHAATGEVLAEHHIDPTKDYQRPTRPA